MSDQNAVDLEKIGQRMFDRKINIDNMNQEIALHFYPERASFTTEIVLGEEFASHLTDPYPILVRRELGDSFSTMLRQADQPWFEVSVEPFDEKIDVPEQKWLDMASKVQRAILYDRRGGFSRAAKIGDYDFAAFGCSVMSHPMNKNRDGVRFRNWHMKNCAWAEDSDGNVGTLHRKAMMTATDIRYNFPNATLPPSIMKQFEPGKDIFAEFPVRHVMMPIEDYSPYRKFPKFAKFASIYYLLEGMQILLEEPSIENDYSVARWQSFDGTPYSFSPATIVALPQARLIQRMMLTLIEAGERQVDPPIVATESAVTSPIDISSAAVTWVDADYDERMGQALRPMELGKNVQLGQDLISSVRNILSEAFYLSKLNMPSARPKTAYETSILVQEYIRNALPIFEPMEQECNVQFLEKVFQKALREGAFGPIEDMPQGLRGKDLRFKFSGPLKQARDRQTVEAYRDVNGLLAEAAAIGPGAVAEIDTRIMLRDAVKSTNAPGGWLNENDVAMQGREKMNEAAAEQKMMQDLSEGVEMAGKAMPLIKEAENV